MDAALVVRLVGIALFVVVLLLIGREVVCWYFRLTRLSSQLDLIHRDLQELTLEIARHERLPRAD
jgi:hypothetical protein